jgi:hypothetical protein
MFQVELEVLGECALNLAPFVGAVLLDAAYRAICKLLRK